MPTLKLTKKAVLGFNDLQKQSSHSLKRFYDSELTGFGITIGKTSKTYFVQRNVKGKLVRVTVGNAKIYKLEEARNKARDLLCQMHNGINPNEEKKKSQVKQMTVRQMMERYLEYNTNMKPSTGEKYKLCIEALEGLMKTSLHYLRKCVLIRSCISGLSMIKSQIFFVIRLQKILI